ncbi:MAG: DUF2442 domain-containing protein [Gemmatimonadota bacterium]
MGSTHHGSGKERGEGEGRPKERVEGRPSPEPKQPGTSEDRLQGEVFESLRDQTAFSQVRVNPETRTIEWPNGADLAPEFLHEMGVEVTQVA